MRIENFHNLKLGHCGCLFLRLLITYAAITKATKIETNMKKVVSSLTVPFGKIDNTKMVR